MLYKERTWNPYFYCITLMPYAVAVALLLIIIIVMNLYYGIKTGYLQKNLSVNNKIIRLHIICTEIFQFDRPSFTCIFWQSKAIVPEGFVVINISIACLMIAIEYAAYNASFHLEDDNYWVSHCAFSGSMFVWLSSLLQGLSCTYFYKIQITAEQHLADCLECFSSLSFFRIYPYVLTFVVLEQHIFFNIMNPHGLSRKRKYFELFC